MRLFKRIVYLIYLWLIEFLEVINQKILIRQNISKLYDWEGNKINIFNIPTRLDHNSIQIKEFANLPIINEIQQVNTIQILQENFYDLEGKEYIADTKNNYLNELAQIIRELGYKPLIVQRGNNFWHLKHDNIDVIGIPSGKSKAMFNVLAHHLIFGRPRMRIYSGLEVAYPNIDQVSIVISYGMSLYSKYDFNNLLPIYRKIFKSLHTFVSSDKVTLACLWELMPKIMPWKKAVYIPYYIDIEKHALNNKTRDKIIITCRYITSLNRSCLFVNEVVKHILDKYQNVEFQFLCQANSEQIELTKFLAELYKNKIFTTLTTDSNSRNIYNKSDITIILTDHNEEAKEACFRAMACGNAVISSPFGKVSDLIINNFNGLLIGLNYLDLQRAVERLINEQDTRFKIAKNAAEVIQSFDKEEWADKWRVLIVDTLDNAYKIKEKIYKK